MTAQELAAIVARDREWPEGGIAAMEAEEDGLLFAVSDRRALLALLRETREALEGVVRQFAYWTDSAGGVYTGGLSVLEDAFVVLGWADPHPLPDRWCDEPGCMKDATMGWPTRPGGTGSNGGYRRTCWEHSDRGRARLAALAEP